MRPCFKVFSTYLVLTVSIFEAVLWRHSSALRHLRRLRVLEIYSSTDVDICQADHSVGEQLRLASLLDRLNAEDLLLDGINFLRVFLGMVPYSKQLFVILKLIFFLFSLSLFLIFC